MDMMSKQIYYQEHREEILEKKRLCHIENKAIIAEKSKVRYDENSDELLEKYKIRYESNKEELKEKLTVIVEEYIGKTQREDIKEQKNTWIFLNFKNILKYTFFIICEYFINFALLAEFGRNGRF